MTRHPSPGLRVALDYAPLVVFFLVNFLIPGDFARRLVASTTGSLSGLGKVEALVIARVIVATAAFVLATIAAMLVSLVKLGSISPMLWISGALVVLFGGLTIYFADARFIQMKPTLVYAIMAALLAFGLLTGRPLLQQLLGTSYPGLTPPGWRKLTINWTLFFVALAVANEVARRALTLDQWVLFKFPGCALVTFFFALANIPMLLKHGLTLEPKQAAARELPPE